MIDGQSVQILLKDAQSKHYSFLPCYPGHAAVSDALVCWQRAQSSSSLPCSS
jgi:hypothetical protein